MRPEVLAAAVKLLLDYKDSADFPACREDGPCPGCAYEAELEWVVNEFKKTLGEKP